MEQEYSCLQAFSYMFYTLNVGSSYSIMVSKDTQRFMYYFLAFGACIRGFSHMREIIVVGGTHLHSKYKGVLLSVVTQDRENHVYPIDFCIMDKENAVSWTFCFEKLKDIAVDESNLCFLSFRQRSIANGIANAHHGYCMMHLAENL